MITDPAPTAAYPSFGQGVGLALLVLAMALVFAPLSQLDRFIGEEAAETVYYVAAFGSSFAILHALRRRRMGHAAYRFWPGSPATVAGLAIGSAAILFGVVAPLSTLVPLFEYEERALRSAGTQTGPFTFVCFVIAAPIFEELIFRGILLDGFLNRYRRWTSIVVSSLIFGAVHVSVVQFITAFVLGCFLGWVYARTRNVGACVVIHAAANLGGFVTRIFVDIGALLDDPPSILETFGGGPVRFMLLDAALLVVLVASIRFLHRRLVGPSVAPAGEGWYSAGGIPDKTL